MWKETRHRAYPGSHYSTKPPVAGILRYSFYGYAATGLLAFYPGDPDRLCSLDSHSWGDIFRTQELLQKAKSIRKEPAPPEILLSLHLRVLLQLLCHCLVASYYAIPATIFGLARLPGFRLFADLDRQYLYESFFPSPHRSQKRGAWL